MLAIWVSSSSAFSKTRLNIWKFTVHVLLKPGLGNFEHYFGLPGGSDGKVSARNAGDPGSIPRLGRSPEEGNGNPLQYSCLENSMDGGPWWATAHGIAKSRTQLSDFTYSLTSV